MCCRVVSLRKDQNRSFTIGQWKEHESSVRHNQHVAEQEELERINAKKNAGNEELTQAEHKILVNKAKNQTSVLSFFSKKKKVPSAAANCPPKDTEPSLSEPSPTSTEPSPSESSPTHNTNMQSTSTNMPSTCPANEDTSKQTITVLTCQGIIPQFREKRVTVECEVFCLEWSYLMMLSTRLVCLLNSTHSFQPNVQVKMEQSEKINPTGVKSASSFKALKIN